MTQLLISVKNVKESLQASYAGVDLIDLKDPSIGALGALATDVVSDIVREVEKGCELSATVGEGHETLGELANDIRLYASLGVSIVKVAVSELFYGKEFITEILKLTGSGVKLVAVFFADTTPDLSLIPSLKRAGFYGAMLDTQFKLTPLFEARTGKYLKEFVRMCEGHHLISGLSGSVNKSHMNALLTSNANFIGLRGGVCVGESRAAMLSYDKIIEVKDVLLKYNKN